MLFRSGADRHGGNLQAQAQRLGCRPDQLLDASASLVPFGPPYGLVRQLSRQLHRSALRAYPDREQLQLRQAIAQWHGLDPAWVLPGNGAAELFTWVARDAAQAGLSLLPVPGFADYGRALATWGGASRVLPLSLSGWLPGEQPLRLLWPESGPQQVLWITNPHNPTGQLWSRASLRPLLARFALVIADEAFLPLVPGGEQHSLIPLLADHPNLVVVRSLTKELAIAGLRLGYALASPQRLQRWQQWRDPWPVNGLAAAAGCLWLNDHRRVEAWQRRVQRWTAREGAWLQQQLAALPALVPMPSAANYLLVRGELEGRPVSLQPLREALEQRHRILLRDCRSFEGLDETWLRIGYQSRRGNRRIVSALKRELPQALSSSSSPASS